ncbi:hypothetical protein R2362_03325 [Mycobacteroides chelonae]|nr:hypothetical protein [Mycobacteroides chelonae]
MTEKEQAEIKRYVESLHLGLPSAAAQQLTVNILRRRIKDMESGERIAS